MARIIETNSGMRRLIKLSTDDIISVIQSYQNISSHKYQSEDIRACLDKTVIYIPEDL